MIQAWSNNCKDHGKRFSIWTIFSLTNTFIEKLIYSYISFLYFLFASRKIFFISSQGDKSKYERFCSYKNARIQNIQIMSTKDKRYMIHDRRFIQLQILYHISQGSLRMIVSIIIMSSQSDIFWMITSFKILECILWLSCFKVLDKDHIIKILPLI